MRILVVFSLLLLIAITGLAEEKEAGTRRPDGSATLEKKPQQGAGQELPREKKKRATRSFKPSEEIGVETTVPFPTDI